jgi:phosphohistidine phosphatase SixA
VGAKGLALQRFVASPRVRAVQTAELFAHALAFLGVVESMPALSFTVPAEHAARELKRLGAVQHVAAFGHMPTISEIAGRITNESRGSLSLCEALWIDQGRVVWAVAPR